MTKEEQEEVLHILEAHERMLAVCRACAETTRDLAWEITRGGKPDFAALRQTIDGAEQALADVGRAEIAIAEMKAALW